MNLVTLYIIIYICFFMVHARSFVCWFNFIRIICTYIYKLSQMHHVWQCIEVIHPSKILYFSPMKLISMTNDIRTLKIREKKHNVIYDLRFFIALRTSCRMVLCMSNKRVSFRRTFGYAEKIWIVSTAKEGDKIYCRRCNWSLLWHRLIRMAAPPLLWMVIGPF